MSEGDILINSQLGSTGSEAPAGPMPSPRSGMHRDSFRDDSGHLLPYIEGIKEAEEESSLLAAVEAANHQQKHFHQDFLPPQILDALRKTSKRSSKTQPKKHVATVVCPPPSNVWNHPQMRSKLRHLTEQPPSLSGAGKDISFLYDSHYHQGDKAKETVLPDSLIPEEYHVVKDPGVVGLEIQDGKFTTTLEDKEKLLRVFPSSYPASRHEVVLLKKVLVDMLRKAGLGEDMEVTGPTQIHRLLDLVKKEQTIYNVVFHELIRQVSVHCLDRGQLLATLRQKYANLLDRIPRQVKSLHDEVMAQRALDRRLSSELSRFHDAVAKLTNELTGVRKHDVEISGQAKEAQQSLESALLESEKNSSLVAEYHDLYEMQRRRLEAHVLELVKEKDIWLKAAHDLAAKVGEEQSLKTVKRIQLGEKTWSKLAGHFAVVLGDKDTQQLSGLQGFVQTCRELLSSVAKNLSKQDSDTTERLEDVAGKMKDFSKEISNGLESGKTIHPTKVRELWLDIKAWEDILSQESELFTGDTVLEWQEKLQKISKQVEGWTEMGIRLFNRHKMVEEESEEDKSVNSEEMKRVNEVMETCLNQLRIRVSGENGLARCFIHLVGPLETWAAKLNLATTGNQIPDSDWRRLVENIGEWVADLENAIDKVGSPVRESATCLHSDDDDISRVKTDVLIKDIQKWMSSTCNEMDNEDSAILEQVSQLHSDMICWMVAVLLRLTETEQQQLNGREAKTRQENDSSDIDSIADLKASGVALASRLSAMTSKIAKCCTDILQEQLQTAQGISSEEAAEMEIRDLKRLQSECKEWVKTASLLVEELIAKNAGLPPPSTSRADLDQAEPVRTREGGIQVLGSDDNVHELPLKAIVKETESSGPTMTPSAAALASDAPIPAGRSGSSHDALLSAVETLQKQLKEAEGRAAVAQERAEKLDSELKEATGKAQKLKERGTQLEKELKEMQQSPKHGPPSRQGGRQTPGSQATKKGAVAVGLAKKTGDRPISRTSPAPQSTKK